MEQGRTMWNRGVIGWSMGGTELDKVKQDGTKWNKVEQ